MVFPKAFESSNNVLGYRWDHVDPVGSASMLQICRDYPVCSVVVEIISTQTCDKPWWEFFPLHLEQKCITRHNIRNMYSTVWPEAVCSICKRRSSHFMTGCRCELGSYLVVKWRSIIRSETGTCEYDILRVSQDVKIIQG